ncbi:hypothetical protein [Pseudomonas aeruginosa]|nr:hypothetical protein [Pseudomonas aeruginosa]
MRKLLIAVLFALPFVALAAPPKTVTLDVQNMTCGLLSFSEDDCTN